MTPGLVCICGEHPVGIALSLGAYCPSWSNKVRMWMVQLISQEGGAVCQIEDFLGIAITWQEMLEHGEVG